MVQILLPGLYVVSYPHVERMGPIYLPIIIAKYMSRSQKPTGIKNILNVCPCAGNLALFLIYGNVYRAPLMGHMLYCTGPSCSADDSRAVVCRAGCALLMGLMLYSVVTPVPR